jgi:hypothetical protein
MKMQCLATNGGLEDGAHSRKIKTKLASAKSHDQRGRRSAKLRTGNRETQETTNVILNLETWGEGETLERHESRTQGDTARNY